MPLPQTGILASIDDMSRMTLEAIGGIADLNAGDVLVVEGQPQNFLYFVLQGDLLVSTTVANKMVELGRLKAGDCFGEMGMLEQTVASATVSSVTEATVWSLSTDQFDLFMAQDNLAAARMLQAIARVLSHRVRTALAQIRAGNMVQIDPALRRAGEPISYRAGQENQKGFDISFGIFEKGPRDYPLAEIPGDIRLD